MTTQDAGRVDGPVEVTAACVVLDIEGTTSPTAAVLGELYDYARPRLGPWITEHRDDPVVARAVADVRRDAGLADDAPGEDVVRVLHEWMDSDVKATPLKALQGQIWAEGFASGDLTSQFFPDVAPALRAWHESGVRLAVFSSGSVASQRPWFRHSDAGDLSGLVGDWFDTVNAGPKREAASYHRIAADARGAVRARLRLRRAGGARRGRSGGLGHGRRRPPGRAAGGRRLRQPSAAWRPSPT